MLVITSLGVVATYLGHSVGTLLDQRFGALAVGGILWHFCNCTYYLAIEGAERVVWIGGHGQAGQSCGLCVCG